MRAQLKSVEQRPHNSSPTQGDFCRWMNSPTKRVHVLTDKLNCAIATDFDLPMIRIKPYRNEVVKWQRLLISRMVKALRKIAKLTLPIYSEKDGEYVYAWPFKPDGEII